MSQDTIDFIVIASAILIYPLAIFSIVKSINSDEKLSRLGFLLTFLLTTAPAIPLIVSDLGMLVFDSPRLQISSLYLEFLWVYWAIAAFPFYQRVCWRVHDAGIGKITAYFCLVPYLNFFIFLYLCIAKPKSSEGDITDVD